MSELTYNYNHDFDDEIGVISFSVDGKFLTSWPCDEDSAHLFEEFQKVFQAGVDSVSSKDGGS